MIQKKIISSHERVLTIYGVSLDSPRGEYDLIQTFIQLDDSFKNLDREPAISYHNKGKVCESVIYRVTKALEYATGVVVSFVPSPYGAIAPCIGVIPDSAQICYGCFGLKRANALANQNDMPISKEWHVSSVNTGRGLVNLGADLSFVVSKLGGEGYLKTYGLSGFSFGLTAELLSLFKFMKWDYPQHQTLIETHTYRQRMLHHIHHVIQKAQLGQDISMLSLGHPFQTRFGWDERGMPIGEQLSTINSQLIELYEGFTHLGPHRLELLDKLNDGLRKMSKKIVRNQENEKVSNIFMAAGRLSLCLFAVCSLIELAQVGSYLAVSSPLSMFGFIGLGLYLIGAVKRVCLDKRRFDREQDIHHDFQQLYRGRSMDRNQLFCDRLRRDPLTLMKTLQVLVQKEQGCQERPLTNVLHLLGLNTQRIVGDTDQRYLKSQLSDPVHFYESHRTHHFETDAVIHENYWGDNNV